MRAHGELARVLGEVAELEHRGGSLLVELDCVELCLRSAQRTRAVKRAGFDEEWRQLGDGDAACFHVGADVLLHRANAALRTCDAATVQTHQCGCGADVAEHGRRIVIELPQPHGVGQLRHALVGAGELRARSGRLALVFLHGDVALRLGRLCGARGGVQAGERGGGGARAPARACDVCRHDGRVRLGGIARRLGGRALLRVGGGARAVRGRGRADEGSEGGRRARRRHDACQGARGGKGVVVCCGQHEVHGDNVRCERASIRQRLGEGVVGRRAARGARLRPRRRHRCGALPLDLQLPGRLAALDVAGGGVARGSGGGDGAARGRLSRVEHAPQRRCALERGGRALALEQRDLEAGGGPARLRNDVRHAVQQ